MRTVSVSTVVFDGYPMEVAIQEVAEAGARSVEPAFIAGYGDFDETAFSDGEAARLSGLAGGAGLAVTAVSAHIDLAAPGAAEKLRRRLGFAAGLGARFLITNAGRASGRGAILSTIASVLRDCERCGVTLALENPGHGSGDLIGRAAEGAALVDEIGAPQVRLNYDAGNVYTYSHGQSRPEHDIADGLDRIVHLHLKDIASVDGGWRFTAIGDGDIAYRTFLAGLPVLLPVAIELPLRLRRPGRGDPVRTEHRLDLPDIRQALRRSLDFVAGALTNRSRPFRH